MSRFAQIDLPSYPIDDVLDVLDFESYFEANKAALTARWDERRAINPSLPPLDAIDIDSEPLAFGLQVLAGREMLLRALVNDKVRSLMLAGARRRALDHIGATYFRTLRRLIIPANPVTGTPDIFEDDETYRRRLALSPEAWSTAGPEGAYLFWAVSASGDVLDVAVYSEDEGLCDAPEIRVVVLSRLGNGTASPQLLSTVEQALRRSDIRPLGDLVTVESAVPLPFSISINLKIRPGASPALVAAEAERRVRSYASGRMRWIGDGEEGPVWLVGRRIRQDTLAANALVEGVEEVEVTSPSTDINAPVVGSTDHYLTAPILTDVTITTELASGSW